ncbi:ParA family partition ATPase [Novosphingobium sp. FSW06-99]|uniref:ParA family partition ATPase n=1 Tax=Novosphingobium sp. FSW06-99 TaxID=1739113 RepID=UPI00076C5202|nr:ParA family partition ATPase [Novosphingobium sp. FSW06-99]KUR78280.1 chromosome partitioning protein ParA [Novosphingobium sp. FSW06-99]
MTTIAIVSQKGGSGKTTLSVNLAAAAEASGAVALIIDTDPQATATQWGAWRSDKAPEVIDSAPPRIQAKVDAAKGQGATFIVIDTPPHADSAASRAVEVADLVLIPCRPSAFDLAAIKTTVSLVRLYDKPAFVVFTAGPPNAPRMYEEASELVREFGIAPCPHMLPDRAVYRHASAAGASVLEFEPDGKAVAEITAVHMWAIAHVNMSTVAVEGV